MSYLGIMRVIPLLLIAAMPVAVQAQGDTAHGSGWRPYTQLVAMADSAERTGDLTFAHRLYTLALQQRNDSDVVLKRALVSLGLGDTTDFCIAHERHALQEKGSALELWKELCVREDSVPFALSGLPERWFSGMVSVTRRWSRSDGRTTHNVHDATDSLRAILSTSHADTAFISCEEMPSFPGGEMEMFRYLGRNLRYPQAQGICISGTVYLQFIVDTDGHVRDPMVLRGIHQIVDEEALRVVRSMPPWTPGRHNGEPVPVQYVLPIRFSLR